MLMARIVIAGVTSGAGKTTVTAAILGALHRRGLNVQPFKAGPDYIDPSYHSRAAGRAARNLDSWMLSSAVVKDLFVRATAASDVSITEGMMGLYDGRADTEDGSTAHLAKLLEAPVILVVDVAKTSRTAAAIALGCQTFDSDRPLAGVILNRVASESHYRWAAGPIEAATGLPVLGYLPGRDDFALPERHLGLIPAAEGSLDAEIFNRLASQAEETLDLDRLLAIARSAGPIIGDATDLFPRETQPIRARIALACDEAFNFYYEDNLDLLRAWGAEIVPFSPLRDSKLPDGVGGIYIGGGFPELYAAELSANHALHRELRQAAECGVPILAECGGLMYLAEGIVDLQGQSHLMAAVVPGWSVIDRPRLSLGYRTATVQKSNFLLEAGEKVRGHEFHWSQPREGVPLPTAAYAFDGTPPRLEGFCADGVLASYLHIHFGSDARLAPRFVAACAKD
jgi:cobyrinic acid a,c-diamide synthase